MSFFSERLKIYLRERGARYDLIDAVFAFPGQYDLLLIVSRVEALGRFLDTEDGKNLLAGYRRAANILRAEEKKSPEEAVSFAEDYEEHVLVEPEERALAEALKETVKKVSETIKNMLVIGYLFEEYFEKDYEGVIRHFAALRGPVNSFFDKVTVNAADPVLRLNRLRLLSGLRRAVHLVADFSKIAG